MARKKYDDDDGRTIVDMSELSRPPLLVPRFDEIAKRRKERNGDEPRQESPQSEVDMSGDERRAAIGGALSATLLIGAVFAAVIGIAIFIMTRLWT